MGIDTGIYNNLLRQPKSIAEYDAEAMQGQQNKLALQITQQKADEYTRGIERTNKLTGMLGGFATGMSAADQGDALTRGGFIDEGRKVIESGAKVNKDQRDTEKADIEIKFKNYELAGQIIGGVKDQATWDLARQETARVFGPEKAAQMPEQYDPALVEQKRVQAMSVKDQLEQTWKAKGYDLDVRKVDETVRNNQAQTATTQRGQNMTASTAAAGRAQSDQQFNTREARIGATPRLGPDAQVRTGGKPMTELQETKYRTQIAKDYQSANTILSNMDEVAVSAAAVKSAPGLKGATGLRAYIPSLPDSEASQAEVKLANLEGKVTSLGKAAAAMSGAVGPMAVQEWKIVRDMIAAVDPKKGKKSLEEQITLVEENAKGAADRIRDAYEKHYSADFERYPQFQAIGGKPKTPPPAAPIQLKSAADYAKVPSGAEYITPDGETRRKK